MKKSIRIIIALSISIALIVFAPTVSAQDYDSSLLVFEYENVSYTGWTTLHDQGTNNYLASAWLRTTDYSNVPAYTIYVAAKIHDLTSNSYVAISAWNPNTTSFYFSFNYSLPHETNNRVCSSGDYQINSASTSSPLTGSLPESSTNSNGIIAETDYANLSDNQPETYSTTPSGLTYGTPAMEKELGYSPDLIAALGANGVSGYLRREDLYPVFTCKEDYCAYLQKLDSNHWTMPIYDLEGNTVDYMLVSAPQTEKFSTVEDAKMYITRLGDDNYLPVTGVNGHLGFMKRSDFDPINFGETANYALACKNRYVPVYDVRDNIIDTFLLYSNISWVDSSSMDAARNSLSKASSKLTAQAWFLSK